MRKFIFSVGIVLSVGLIVYGMLLTVPDKNLLNHDIVKYMNGDVYNYMIEASLLSGEIAAAKTEKIVSIVGGFILLILSFLIYDMGDSSRIEKMLEKIVFNTTQPKPSIPSNPSQKAKIDTMSCKENYVKSIPLNIGESDDSYWDRVSKKEDTPYVSRNPGETDSHYWERVESLLPLKS
jgi:hypothetical protein